MAMKLRDHTMSTCIRTKTPAHHGSLTHWEVTKGTISQCIISNASQVWAYGNGNGMYVIFTASWKATMPFAISWKARERMGGGMLNTPVSMFSTMRNWIQEKSNSTLQCEVFTASKLSSSKPSGSIKSKENAVMSSMPSTSWFNSSSSANAAAWSMLNSRMRICLKRITFHSGSLEYLQNATRALHASNHSARIWWVAVQPSQNLLYACDVRKTMRKPTRNENPDQAWLSSRIESTSSRVGMYPWLIEYLSTPVSTAQGTAMHMDWGKTLPLIIIIFMKKP
mmetsp:Transcript_75904/g.232329  ORF Transcript_75904/g.232329 Transcript_75904/m.232329 type:complete len:281 (-) Transcript_75904:97-939(-)